MKGEAGDIVRVFLQTPTGCCHVDITRAVLHRHIQVRLHCRRLRGFHTPLAVFSKQSHLCLCRRASFGHPDNTLNFFRPSCCAHPAVYGTYCPVYCYYSQLLCLLLLLLVMMR